MYASGETCTCALAAGTATTRTRAQCPTRTYLFSQVDDIV
jgi:hypothetical protein